MATFCNDCGADLRRCETKGCDELVCECTGNVREVVECATCFKVRAAEFAWMGPLAAQANQTRRDLGLCLDASDSEVMEAARGLK